MDTYNLEELLGWDIALLVWAIELLEGYELRIGFGLPSSIRDSELKSHICTTSITEGGNNWY